MPPSGSIARWRGRGRTFKGAPKTPPMPYDERGAAIQEATSLKAKTAKPTNVGKGYQGVTYNPPAISNPIPNVVNWWNTVGSSDVYRLYLANQLAQNANIQPSTNYQNTYNTYTNSIQASQQAEAQRRAALQTTTQTPVTQPSLSYRRGYHNQVMLQNIQNGTYANQGYEANQSLPAPTLGNGSSATSNGGGNGYGYSYPSYDYTPTSYTNYNNSFTRYRQGQANQSAQAPAPMTSNAVVPTASRAYATQNQAARWIQLLTSWKI